MLNDVHTNNLRHTVTLVTRMVRTQRDRKKGRSKANRKRAKLDKMNSFKNDGSFLAQFMTTQTAGGDGKKEEGEKKGSEKEEKDADGE